MGHRSNPCILLPAEVLYYKIANMEKLVSKKVIKMLSDAFVFEEKSLFEFQYGCYEKLPGFLNKNELRRARMILDIMMVQTLNHANIIGDFLAKFYERTAKRI